MISTTNSEFSKGQIIYLTPGGRVNSTFAGHYDLAVFLMMVLSVLAALIFTTRKLLINSWYGVLGVFSAFVLVLTAARFSFFAAIGGIVAALVLSKKYKLVILILILAVGVLVYPSQLQKRLISTVSVNILGGGERYVATPDEKERSQLNLSTIPPSSSPSASISAEEKDSTGPAKSVADIAPGEPVDPTELGVYRSFQIRLNVEWPRAINAFLKNPLLGTGYSSIGVATDNDFLRSIGEVGVLGTLSFALILIEIVKRVIQNFKSGNKFIRNFSAGILAMILAFLLNAIFIDVFEASKVAALFWLIIGVNLAMFKAEE